MGTTQLRTPAMTEGRCYVHIPLRGWRRETIATSEAFFRQIELIHMVISDNNEMERRIIGDHMSEVHTLQMINGKKSAYYYLRDVRWCEHRLKILSIPMSQLAGLKEIAERYGRIVVRRTFTTARPIANREFPFTNRNFRTLLIKSVT